MPDARLSRRDFIRRTALTAAAVPAAGTLLSLVPPLASARPGLRAPRPRNDVYVRKDVLDLTQQEQDDFTNAILALKSMPSPWDPALSYYDQFVWWHKQTFKCDIAAAHMGPAFLPWHRLYLVYFEDALNATGVSVNPIAVPYWDWPEPGSADVVFSADFMSPAGDPALGYVVTEGPFRRNNYRINVFDPRVNDPVRATNLRRRFATTVEGSYPGGIQLPTQAEVDAALAVEHYDHAPWDPASPPSKSFRNNIEGWRERTGMECAPGGMEPTDGPHPRSVMHNAVHLWVGGVWGTDGGQQGQMVMNSSPNDPAFWIHHSNIDRLWWAWEQLHGMEFRPVTGAMKGHNLNDKMWPYKTIGDPTRIADLLDIAPWGYTYA